MGEGKKWKGQAAGPENTVLGGGSRARGTQRRYVKGKRSHRKVGTLKASELGEPRGAAGWSRDLKKETQLAMYP